MTEELACSAATAAFCFWLAIGLPDRLHAQAAPKLPSKAKLQNTIFPAKQSQSNSPYTIFGQDFVTWLFLAK